MVTSSRIQEKILELLSDERKHSIQDIKKYLAKVNLRDYTVAAHPLLYICEWQYQKN